MRSRTSCCWWRSDNVGAGLLVLRRVVFGSDDDVSGALTLVGARQPDVGDRALPEVQEPAGGVAGGVFHHQWCAFEVEEVQNIRRGQVCGDDAPLFLQDFRTTKSVSFVTPYACACAVRQVAMLTSG